MLERKAVRLQFMTLTKKHVITDNALRGKRQMKTFIDMCVEGTKKFEDLDDFIDEWHKSDSKIDLRKAIGLTKSQYEDFLRDDAFIEDLILQEKAK